MQKVRAYAALSRERPLVPHEIVRRDPGPHDVVIDVAFCGVCHSDVHQARDEWGGAQFPMVPGHEVAGVVSKVGSSVKKFKVGDRAGVGTVVDSCRKCQACKDDEQQQCEVHAAFTYNSTEMDEKTPTQGGYSASIVVDEEFAFRIPMNLKLEAVAPLLCAGITTYTPLRRFGVGQGMHVGVMGLGGLGHMGVQLAAAMGAEVTVLSTSASKKADALKLGAHDFIVTKDADLSKHTHRFDVILNTVSAAHRYSPILATLKRKGTLVVLGLPPEPEPLDAGTLIDGGRQIAGSLTGGVNITQSMLDFCGEKNVTAWVEVLPVSKVNEAFERTVAADVRFRFSLDLSELKR